MKKIFLTIFFIFITGVWGMTAFAANTRETLSTVENSILGYDLSNLSDIQRIENLEEYLYGEKRTGAASKRLENLLNDSGITVQAKKAVKQQPHLTNQQNNTEERQQELNIPVKKASELKEDETVDYPIVDKMEKDLFNQDYKNENIYTRLDRLEKTVFNKTSRADLSTRVSKLQEVLLPKSRQTASSYGSYTQDDINRLYNSTGLAPVDENTVPFQLALLENSIFKKDYSGDNNMNRLSRLEQQLFSRTFPNDSDVQRVQRLSAAFEAKKNSRTYENNKRMQNMAAITQIGGILLMILAILL